VTRRSRAALTVAVTFVVAAIAVLAFAPSGDAHVGHDQKSLLPGRWYQTVVDNDYATWMTLSTSQFRLDCDGGGAGCGTKWNAPTQAALDDWNAADTTVQLDVQADIQDSYDVNIFIDDDAMGNPFILGFAQSYDADYVACNFGCTYRYGWAVMGDDAHTGVYGTALQRQGTVVHELGHVLTLAHEADPCGVGGTPQSVMSYDCIDPVAVGGVEAVDLQDWDVCGVNHAYYDPNIDFAGCGLPITTPTPGPSTTPTPAPTATPTPAPSGSGTPTPTTTLTPTPGGPGSPTVTPDGSPNPTPGGSSSPTATPEPTATPTPSPTSTPTPEPILKGDNNCDGQVSAVDALSGLRHAGGLPTNQPDSCPAIGSASLNVFGDIDCDDDVDPVDALSILRYIAGMSVKLPAGCPALGPA